MSSLLYCLVFLLPLTTTSFPLCNSTELELIAKAFTAVTNLRPTELLSSTTCANGSTEIKLPSRNLTGSLSWTWLAKVGTLSSVDLSDNLLRGSIPSKFWETATSLADVNLASNQLGGTIRSGPSRDGASKLQKLNLSGNRFTNSGSLSGFVGLKVLNLSGNRLTYMPEGIEQLRTLERLDISGCNMSGKVKPISVLGSLKYLDLSMNKLNGIFPDDFPATNGLLFLNISVNNFSGMVDAEQYKKFGASAFTSSGALLPPDSSAGSGSGSNSSTSSGTKQKEKPISSFPKHDHPEQQKENKNEKNNIKTKLTSQSAVLGMSIGGASLALVTIVCCCRRVRQSKNYNKNNRWTKHSRRFDTEAAWVIEATGTAAGSIAPVIMFEKPLMNLTFTDLVVATSGFGKESQFAEGKSTGPIYRAVLPGDMNVAIKVLEKEREVEGVEAKTMFHELAGVKHPNVLPLLGYCIAGEKKLLLYEYMENGDLHRWLHELPLMERHRHGLDAEDWTVDMDVGAAMTTAWGSWPTRYRIALGIARGLAFLHHASGRGPMVHGRVVASNVLLDEELEPKIAGVGIGGESGDGTTEADVYGYGMVLTELLTGRVGREDTVKWAREMVRKGNGLSGLDPRIRSGADSEEREMGEALRVAYLCTAESPPKRPSMKQVVGLLKDVRPLAACG